MSSTDFADLDPDERRGAQASAYQEAEEFQFPEGNTLEPFSFLRQTAAIALGMRYGSLSEEEIQRAENPKYAILKKLQADLPKVEAKAKKAKRGQGKVELEEAAEAMRQQIKELEDEPEIVTSYPAMILDAAIVLWLCSQPDSVCYRARRKPRDYEGQIDTWAEKNGVSMVGEGPGSATSVFIGIVNALNKVEGKPIIKGDENAEGESPN